MTVIILRTVINLEKTFGGSTTYPYDEAAILRHDHMLDARVRTQVRWAAMAGRGSKEAEDGT